MSLTNKYRVFEVARDFGLPSKEVMGILTQYVTAPKNHQQALSDDELNLIFGLLTEQNQIESIEVIFSEVYVPSEQKPSLPEEPAEAEAAPEPEAKAGDAAKDTADTAAAAPSAPSQAAPPPVQPAKPAAPPQPKGERKTRVVDTRGGVVDLRRYDDRVEQLVPEKADRMKQGKEKFKKTPDKKAGGFISQKRRQEEQERLRRLRIEALKKQQLKVLIPDEINVGELAARLKKTGTDVVKKLMKLGVMANLSQSVDFDTASLVAMEFGAKVQREVIVTIEERLIDEREDDAADLIDRDPVVVVMGHVDHGKTSLLDYIRNADVVSGEAGGITQHIGAYRVHVQNRGVTFLDTPGHAAFTSMRQRGASVTDIAILVVAADDGIMPQTIEAINHAKAAEVPIIVAVNKIDKEGANPDRIMQQLTEYGLVPEEWGGETIVCPVSAKNGTGIDHLLEMILLTSEMRELKANPDRAARGTVIEAKLDKGRGPVATVLVQNGTLKQSDIVIAGCTVGRVRAMTDDKGKKLEEAGPSMPVEIIGLSEVPDAGDTFHTVSDERMARTLVDQRKQEEKDKLGASLSGKVTLEDLYAQIQQGQIKNLNIIVKADVQGSAEAVKASLEKIANEEVRVSVVHSAVGAVNESDVLLASTTGAIIVGFNVRADGSAAQNAAAAGVDLRYYRVIYDCIEEIEQAMKGMLAPKFRELVLGHAEVRQIFKASSIGTIAGCHVTSGKMLRSASVRLLRDSIVIYEGELSSLKRFKDDAKEVAAGYECGISLEKFNDIKEGDIFEAFTMEQIIPE